MNFIDHVVDRTIQIQNGLTLVVQEIPVAGPLCISPIKALISVAQTIVGVAMSLFISLPYVSGHFSEWSSERKRVVQSLFPRMGVQTLFYSILNTLTLGLVHYPVPKLVVGLRI